MARYNPDKYIGRCVVVAHGSGVDSGKRGRVVSRTNVRVRGDGVPALPGHYKPVNWRNEVAVRLDSGELITMYRERLRDCSTNAILRGTARRKRRKR